MLYMIGIGLSDEKDISVKGLEVVKKCKFVYLENYTNILTVDEKALGKFYGREVFLADRDMIENSSDKILNDAILIYDIFHVS